MSEVGKSKKIVEESDKDGIFEDLISVSSDIHEIEDVEDDGIDSITYKTELVSLLIMASQVSLATVTRIALMSIDNAFLGHLGKQELAAAAIAGIWLNVPLGAVWAGAAALITLCGQSYGAKNYELTGIWLQIGVIITFIMAIPVFIWYWFIYYPMYFSTEDSRVVELGATFSKVISFSIFPNLFYACLRQYFQSMEIMWPTTVVGILSIGICLLANQLLIHGVGAWKGLGFIGSPLATVVSCWFQPIALLTICVLWKGYHKKTWRGIKLEEFTKRRMVDYFKLALPIAGNSLVANLCESIGTLIAAKMGTTVVTSNAVIFSLWGVMWALFWGFGCSTQVKVANYMGANKPKSAKKLAIIGFSCTVITVSILATISLVAGRNILGLFTNDQSILELSVHTLPLFVLAFSLESMEMLIASVLEGMGIVKTVLVISTIATWGLNLPFAYFMGIHMGWGLTALWLAVAIQEGFKFVSFAILISCTSFEKQAQKVYEQMKIDDEKQNLENESNVEESETTPLIKNLSTESYQTNRTNQTNQTSHSHNINNTSTPLNISGSDDHATEDALKLSFSTSIRSLHSINTQYNN